MRQIFPEWYAPSEVELGSLLETATIALDANVLLDLYRVSTSQRDQILDLLNQENVQPRVWMPYQAALEYQRSRLKVARNTKATIGLFRSQSLSCPRRYTPPWMLCGTMPCAGSCTRRLKEVLGPVHEPLPCSCFDSLESANVIAADGIYSVDPIRDRI